jgi:hypothetical protein
MIGHQFLSKKNTSTAPLHHHVWGTPVANLHTSYEALPPNFSLTANMLAGAFAGIAVRSRGRCHVLASANLLIGTLGDVPGRSPQGMHLLFELLLPYGRCSDSQKTRMQIVNPSPSAMYSGISNAMVTISRAEGFWSLWRGLSSVVMGAGWSV